MKPRKHNVQRKNPAKSTNKAEPVCLEEQPIPVAAETATSELKGTDRIQPPYFRRPWVVLLVLFALVVTGFTWFYVARKQKLELAEARRLELMQAFYDRQIRDAEKALSDAKIFLESSNWSKFEVSYRRAKALDSKGVLGVELALLKRQQSLQKALQKKEEIQRNVRLQVNEFLENKQFTEAEKILKQFLLKYPSTTEAENRLREVKALEAEYLEKERLRQINDIRKTINGKLAKGQWRQAKRNINQLEQLNVSSGVLVELLGSIEKVEQKEKRKRKKAMQVIASVKALDTGEYSQDLIDRLDRALLEAPGVSELSAWRDKIVARPRIIQVPQELANLEQALALVRAGDEILLGDGIFSGNITINKSVTIRGQGGGKTVIKQSNQEGSGIIFSGGNNLMIGVDIHGEGLNLGDQGYAGILHKGGNLILKECNILRSSGHGVAVVGGSLTMSSCTIFESAWNGVSILGANSIAKLNDISIKQANQHGIEIWDSANLELLDNVSVSSCDGGGVIVAGKGSQMRASNAEFSNNRECGVAVGLGAALILNSCQIEGNLLSGLCAEGEGSKVKLQYIQAINNGQAGIWIGNGVLVEQFSSCKVSGNKMMQQRLPRVKHKE